MTVSKSFRNLRIYLSSTDKLNHKPAYEAIVFQAKDQGLSGATVTRGVLGYGASSVIHSARFWELTEKLPMIVEIIDEKHKIIDFYKIIKPDLEKMSKGCLVTIEKVDVLLYQSGKKN